MNKIIGLVGESPYDTAAIKNLLIQKYKDVTYKALIKHINGYNLDLPKTQKFLQIEVARIKPDIIIFIRDSDGIWTETQKIKKVETWYQNLSDVVTCQKKLLINIYELEALIFADIDTFNKVYNTSIKGNRDVTYIKQPKEELMRKTDNQKNKIKKKYAESHCPELFKLLKIDIVNKNCAYFKAFLKDFSDMLE